MATRLLLFNDPHYSAVPPTSRTESYGEDILAKLSELAEISKKLKVDAVCCTGDWFHRKVNVTYRETLNLVDVLKEFEKPILSILGNHDISAHNFESWRNRPVGVLVKSEVIQLLDEMGWATPDVCITGSSYHYAYDETDDAYRSPVDRKLDKWLENTDFTRLHLTHGMVVDKPFPFGPHHTIEQVEKISNTDIIFNGHNHTFYIPQKRNKGTTVFNIGSISRGSIAESDLKRIPQYMILQAEGGKWDHRIVPLKTIRPATEVFRADRIFREDEEEGRDVSEFVESLRNAMEETDIIDESELIRRVGREMEATDVAIEQAMDYLEVVG